MSYSGYALERAKLELKADLDKYGIEVNSNARIIVYHNVARQYDPGTEFRIYRRDLKMYIKLEKEAEAKRIQDNQGRLL